MLHVNCVMELALALS